MSQESKVLQMLRKEGLHGVKNYKFPEARILSYTKIISNLRKDGYTILKERQLLPNGRATGVNRYVLIEETKKPWWKK